MWYKDNNISISKRACDQVTNKKKMLVPHRIICFESSPYLVPPTAAYVGFKRVKRPFSLIMNDYAISHELLLTAFEYNLAKQDHPATRNSTAIAYESQKVQVSLQTNSHKAAIHLLSATLVCWKCSHGDPLG